MKIISIEHVVRVMLRGNTYSSSLIPEWLVDHRNSIQGKLYMHNATSCPMVHLLPLANNVPAVDITYEDIGVVDAMNASIEISVVKSRCHGNDGRLWNNDKVSITASLQTMCVKSNKNTGRNIAIKQDSYLLLHDGKDSLLLFAYELPQVRVRDRQEMLIQ